MVELFYNIEYWNLYKIFKFFIFNSGLCYKKYNKTLNQRMETGSPV